MNINSNYNQQYAVSYKTEASNVEISGDKQSIRHSFTEIMAKVANGELSPEQAKTETEKNFSLTEQQPQNTDSDFGGLRETLPGEFSHWDPDRASATRFEAAMFGGQNTSFTDYIEMTRNPEKVIEESKAGYDKFKELRPQSVALLTKMDRTDSFTVSIADNGAVKVDWNNQVERNSVNTTDYESMQVWIQKNQTELTESGEAYSAYALSKSIKDYAAATGITREVLMNRSSVPIEGREGAFKSTTVELDEYLLKMKRYADNAFSNNPKSYADIDAWGHPGYPISSAGNYASLLPNMT
jgi:hypothetical protein